LSLKLDSFISILICPVCHQKLVAGDKELQCKCCGNNYPILNDIPILIDGSKSIAKFEDYKNAYSSSLRIHAQQKIAKKYLPNLTLNLKAEQNYLRLKKLIQRRSNKQLGLVIGGAVMGKGFEKLANAKGLSLIESDIAFGPQTGLICDAHSLPFEDASLDLVIAQAVLEHVLDPMRCVAEIWRVLKSDGYVYSETPFMQQVHEGSYDFTRFTHLGHRRLFKQFSEIDSGALAGPGTVLLWSYEHLLLSCITSKKVRNVLKAFARITGGWIKNIDRWLINKPGTFDCASAYYFLGQRSEAVLSTSELIQSYKGNQ